MDNSEEKIPVLPYAMSPSDYAYVVLGKIPQMTSIVKYVNTGRIDTVELRDEISDPLTGKVFRVRTIKWVRVPESERILNKQYQRNIQNIGPEETRERWQWVLDIDPEKLPKCPKLERLKQVERDMVKIRGIILPYFSTHRDLTKPGIIDLFSLKHGPEFPNISNQQVGKVVEWFNRNGYIESAGRKHPEDKRQTVLVITSKGTSYMNKEAKNIV